MRNWRISASIYLWGRHDDGRRIHGVLHLVGGDQRAECLAAVRSGVGSVAVRHAGAAMSAVVGTIYGATVALIIWWLFLDED